MQYFVGDESTMVWVVQFDIAKHHAWGDFKYTFLLQFFKYN